MRSKKQVHQDFTQSTQKLLSALNEFPEDHFQSSGPNGGWSAAEIAEHIIKSEAGLVKFFGEDAESTERDPEQKIELMKEKMLNFQQKFSAPSQVEPNDGPKDRQQLIDKLQDIRQRIAGMIEIEDLTKLLTVFGHPGFGTLTRVEWLYFNIYHAERHVEQVEDLKKHLVS
jgi:uncharacterized damage-inducible protein DinB